MKKVNKKWGHELLIVNREFCGKFLKLKKGYHCSYHRHPVKDEAFHILHGLVGMRIGSEETILKPGDTVIIEPRTLHSFAGLSKGEYSTIIEFSTHHEDSDTERVTESGKLTNEEIKQWRHLIIAQKRK